MRYCIEHEMAAKAENESCRRMAWQEARDGRADDGVRAKDHLLFSVKSRHSKRAQVELFPAWAVKPLFRTTIKARAWQFRVAAKRHQLGFCTVRANDAQCVICSTGMSFSASVTARAYVLNCRDGDARPQAIAYSRVDTGPSPSAVPSNSNFQASHSGLEHGLIAQSC